MRERAIRRATTDDITEIVRLARGYLKESPHKAILGFITDEQLEDFTRAVLSVGTILVSEGDGALSGMLALVPARNALTDRSYLEDLVWFIEKPYRALYLANLFVNEAVTVGREAGLPAVKMTSPTQSAVGVLLARKGFREVETAWVLDLGPP